MRRRHEQDLVFALLALAPLIGAISLGLLSALAHRVRGRGPARAPARLSGQALAALLDRLADRVGRLDPQARFWGPAAAGLLLGLLWTLIDG